MKVQQLDEQIIKEIGHAFGYYDYGDETGLVSAYRSKEAAAVYIEGYVRMALKGGFLYTTGEKKEGFIAYKLPQDKLGFGAAMQLVKGFFQSMNLKELIRLLNGMSKGGPSLRDRMGKEKRPCIFVGLVCVLEEYQGQGNMRKLMNLAFEEGNKYNLPVVLDTDAKSKCDKYMHLGMELAGIRDLGEYGIIYDLIKYPDKKK